MLEDDGVPATTAGGPGGRYVLRPAERSAPVVAAPSVLPESYGTGRLLLVARDPFWLYAHWDFTEAQLNHALARAGRGQLALRVFTADDAVVADESLATAARNWFVKVPRGGARYHAELGIRSGKSTWTSLARSEETLTPAETASTEDWVRFETLPPSIPMATLLQLVEEALPAHPPLLEAIAQLRAAGRTDVPIPAAPPVAPWPPGQEQALARLINLDEARRVWVGSLEITELVRRQLLGGAAGGPGGAWAAGPEGSPHPAPGMVTGPSSPSGGEAGAEGTGRGFWFNVNVELIVYGATDPAATVTVGDRAIRLRPDGTFSYRFAFPDGQYGMPIRAVSPDGVEERVAELGFVRSSTFRGGVGAHPQDAGLRTPGADNIPPGAR